MAAPYSAGELPSRLDELNRKLRSADDALRWAAHQFPGGRLVDVTSFGPSGLVILHRLLVLNLLDQVPVVTIDTLHLFNETYRFIDDVRQHNTFPGMQLHVYRPRVHETRASFDAAYGAGLWETDADAYNALSKGEPLARSLDDLRAQAWITGRRRSQGGERSQLRAVEVDDGGEEAPRDDGDVRFKINPLVRWSYQDVWNYIHRHRIPYNPLHDAGYKSIGDTMTTLPVDRDAPERSGRFAGLDITECGIHQRRHRGKHSNEEDSTDTPHLECTGCLELDALETLRNRPSKDVLLEFYSPSCGGCRAFAPVFDNIARRLPPQFVRVARFDVERHGMPDAAADILGGEVEATPSLFLIRRDPFEVARYEGKYKSAPILKWLAQETDYVTIR
jgi:phosphoadenosine phosphosulfate reductase